VRRSIVGYHRDEADDWVAELTCGHNQHVRHRPPFQARPWVVDAEGRAARLGTPLDCPLCDRAELPDGLRLVRSSKEWDERTIPPGLLHANHVASGTWGRILVRRGRLQFVASTAPPISLVLGPGSTQAIPPDVEHHVRPLGAVSFSIDFLGVDEHDPGAPAGDVTPPAQPVPDEGGDPACWAGLLCPECGVVLDGGSHREGCQAAFRG
jgi:tellurite resistance-related uncharacterized protein